MENHPQPQSNLQKFFSVQRLAYTLIIIALFTYFVVIAKALLIPITFAMLLAFMLKPICSFYDRYISNNFLSILISSLSILIPIFIIMFLFSVKVSSVFSNLPAIGNQLKKGIANSTQWLQSKGRETGLMDKNQINESMDQLIDGVISFIQSSLSSTPDVLLSIFISILFTFFFLFYRSGLKNFLVAQFSKDIQEEVIETMTKIQRVAQKYLNGLGLVMLIMGILNSIGLMLIGIDHAMLWGFLAAILTVIPYIGTAIGGLLPFLFAAATTDTTWQPVAVLVYYFLIQQVEGNLITPKVIGNSVSINPMVAILSLIIGGYLWGISGVILSLPIIAIVRIICAEINWLKPIALLMSSQLYNKEEKFNKEKFRLSSIFKIKPKSRNP